MATTNMRAQSTPGVSTTRLFLASLTGTGTPNASGYLSASEYGGWYLFNNITEALVGMFFYQLQNSSNQVLACGLVNLVDDTGTYFGFDPPSSNAPTWHNLDAAITSRAVASDITAGLTTQGYTTTRAPKLDNLDATISSRNSTTPPTAAANATAVWDALTSPSVTAGSFGLLVKTDLDATISSRATPANVTTQLTAQGLTSTRAGYLDNLDATVSSRASASSLATLSSTNQTEHDATQATLAALDVTTQVQGGLTAQGYTTTRAPKLDNLDATVSSREAESAASTRATTNQTEHDATQSTLAGLNIAAACTSALTTQGLTSTRAGYLDYLDASISSRESESSASTRATTNQTEHDATQATLAGLTVSVDEDAIAAAVWDALTADSVLTGSFGLLVKTNLDAAVTSRAVASDVSAGLTSQGYSTTRAGKLDSLDNLDAAVSTRVTPAQVLTQLDTQGLTNTRAVKLDNLDAAVTSRATPAQVTTALTDQGLTSTRAGKLDNLDATIATRATPAQVSTALTDQGLTSTRAGYLDHIAIAPPSLSDISDDLTPKISLASDQATIAATNTQPEP